MGEVSTIAALATAPAPAGLAVVRVSGPRCRNVLRGIFKSKKKFPTDFPRELVFGELLDFLSGEPIDTCLAVFMPGPFSFTGEDIAEFQFHGSPLLIERVLRSLFAFGVTPAEPGEFTKRAFLNGKLDLVQAEAIADLISAGSEESLRIATEALQGKLSSAVHELGEPLRDALAELEASIDFPEEEISPKTLASIADALHSIKGSIEALLHTYQYGHVIREGFRVLLYGRTNAGKSSLLNAVLNTQRAIVTDVAGTTRDVIEEALTYQGFRFVFCDVAGVRETDDSVEQIGVSLAKDRIEWADVVWFIADASSPEESWRPLLEELREKAKEIWLVVNKVDLNRKAIGTIICDSHTCTHNFYISAKTKSGCDSLLQALVALVKDRLPSMSEANLVVTNERHRNALMLAEEGVSRAINAIKDKLPSEFICGELRVSLSALNEIVGKTYTEDILGRIFSKFCIGK